MSGGASRGLEGSSCQAKGVRGWSYAPTASYGTSPNGSLCADGWSTWSPQSSQLKAQTEQLQRVMLESEDPPLVHVQAEGSSPKPGFHDGESPRLRYSTGFETTAKK